MGLRCSKVPITSDQPKELPLDDWASCLLIGVGRCRTVDRLHRLYRDWEAEIQGHARRDEILEAMRIKKAELIRMLGDENGHQST